MKIMGLILLLVGCDCGTRDEPVYCQTPEGRWILATMSECEGYRGVVHQ